MKQLFTSLLLLGFSYATFSQDYVKIGNTKYDAKDYEGAALDYQKATEKTPKNKIAWYNLAMAKDQLGLYDEAIMYFTKSLEIDPNYTDALFRRGYSKEDNGTPLEAVADYTRVLEIDPGYIEAYFERGYSNVSAANYTIAITDYNDYISKGGTKLMDVYYELGLAKNRSSDYNGALADLKKAGELGKKDKYALYEVGFAYEGLTEWQKAVDIYSKVIEMDDTYFDAWHGRGLCKISLLDYDGGCADLRKADELGSENAYLDVMDYCGE